MLLKFVLHGLGLAITATNVNAKAIPAPVDESAGGEIVRFKRDAILETRDIELAELHQVNLTQSKQDVCSYLIPRFIAKSIV